MRLRYWVLLILLVAGLVLVFLANYVNDHQLSLMLSSVGILILISLLIGVFGLLVGGVEDTEKIMEHF